jgi:hypothetical protein
MHQRGQLAKEVVTRALTCPISLGLLATSVLLLLTPALWPLALSGFLAELAFVPMLIRSGRFVRAVQEEARQLEGWRHAARFAQIQATTDRSTSELLGRIQRLHERLLREWDAAAGSAAVPGALSFSREQVSGLMDQCLRLAEKRRPLLTYLQETKPLALQAQAVQLQEKWERCHDDVARQLYERALRQKRSELENYSAIQAAVARLDGQLEAIECSFGSLLGRVVRLKSADATHAGVARDQLCRDLEELTAGVAALEESVNEALAT